MPGNMWSHNFGMGGMIFWWVLLGIAFALLVRYATRPGKDEDKGTNEPKDAAHEILDERYARGEIGREEYEQKKHDLDEQ